MITIINKLNIFINFFFLVVFLVHVSFIAFNLKNPEYPSIKVYQKNLEDLGYYPISIKLCAKQNASVKNMFRKFGYSHDYKFFIGESLYNTSIKGWNGHTEDGNTLTSLNGE